LRVSEDAIRSAFPEPEVEPIPSSGGVFEVRAWDGGSKGRLVHSKKATGTFPSEDPRSSRR
jgi:predicted Rdx family selenoprotein